MSKLRAVSLFSGLGGMDLGLMGDFDYLGKHYEKNNIEVKFSVDFDKKVCNLFNANFKHQCINSDITEINSDEIPEHDILIGGFPCQSFSVVAQNPKRLGVNDGKGLLFLEMCRILKTKKPRFFIAENVKGLLSANKKEAFPLIINEFKKAGYHVKFKVLNSKNFGVPQKRERVFIVGFKFLKDYKQFKFPEGSESFVPLKTVLDPEEQIESKFYFSKKAVEGLKNTKNYKSMNKGRVQDVNSPCNTVNSHLAKTSLNSTDPVLFINGKYRMFTPREVARIQSFPERFILNESKTVNYRGLGNAVPPVLMWHLVQEFKPLIK